MRVVTYESQRGARAGLLAGDRVVDAFYVRSAAGAKIEDAATLVEIERALLHVLAG